MSKPWSDPDADPIQDLIDTAAAFSQRGQPRTCKFIVSIMNELRLEKWCMDNGTTLQAELDQIANRFGFVDGCTVVNP